jgi:hypothetical protein
VSAVLHPIGWALGLCCCVAAIYAAAGAALERPDVLRLEASADTASVVTADYSVDPEQARRPPLNPQIFGAIAVDENALDDSPTPAPARPEAGDGTEDAADPSTPRPRANAVTPDPTQPLADTPGTDPASTSTPRTKPTATKSPKPEPTATHPPEPTHTRPPAHTPTKTPTSTKTPVPTKPAVPTKTPSPTKTPKLDPTATKTPLPIPTIKIPWRCRTAETGDHQGKDNNRKRRCATPTPWPDDWLDDNDWW